MSVLTDLFSSLSMTALLAIGALLYFVFLSVYRLTLHPLAKFPGPVLNAVSPFPGIVSLLTGRLGMSYHQLHKQYGPVVRVAPNELSFNTAQAWDDIYGHRSGARAGRPNMAKDPVHVGSVAPIPGVSTLTMADDVNHSRQRRALAHAFSQKAVEEQEAVVNGYIDKLVVSLKKKSAAGEEFNLVDWLNFTTFDIIGDLAFGEPFGCLAEGQFHDWVSLIFETVKAGALEQATRRFAAVGSLAQEVLMGMIPRSVRGKRILHLEKSKEKVLRRLALEGGDLDKDFVGGAGVGSASPTRPDFIAYILRQRTRHALKRDELVVNGALFIVAGSETTANALSGLLARLLRNKEKMSKLVAEIRSAFATEPEITNEAVRTRLKYCNACIREGLRIHPPVPIGLLRTVPAGGESISGFAVPGGTSVGVTQWAAAHSPSNWADADEFVPERFLPESEVGSKVAARYANDNHDSVQPFSTGPRGCIGKHLAYLEMRMILVRLLWNFDVHSVDGAWKWDPRGDMKHMRAFTTWEKPDLNVRVVNVRR